MLPANERLVFPLDVQTRDEARALLTQLAGAVPVFKVGLELFTAEGPGAIDDVHARGAQCFLDLKLHDISATVASAVRSAARHGVRYLTLHAANGPEALRLAAEAAAGTSVELLAVTVLTSLDAAALSAIGLEGGTEGATLRLAKLAQGAGIDGLVCSPHECALLRRELGDRTKLVVPGVRPAGAAHGDQKRVATPNEAIRSGADLLVVGRPIRSASDPRAAALAVMREIEEALS